MADPDSHNTILIHLDYLKRGIDGINDRLDEQNGRTRKNEQAIAVLEDRSSATRQTSAAWGGGLGAGAGAAIAALWHILSGGGK
jgi:hypothetical protein